MAKLSDGIRTKIAVDNSLKELFKQFLGEKINPHTKAHYKTTIAPFIEWMAQSEVTELSHLTQTLETAAYDVTFPRQIFIRYHEHVKESDKYTLRTIHGIMADVRTFIKWLSDEGKLPVYPLRSKDVPPKPKEQLDAFTNEEIEKLDKATAGKDWNEARSRALMRVLLDCGLRRGELLGLRIEDVRLDSCEIRVRAENAKNRKERNPNFGKVTQEALEDYLEHRNYRKTSEPLWYGVRGPLGYDGIGQLLDRLGQKAGVKDVAAHKFRRTCAITMIRNGASVFAVKNFLGHESLQVLERYAKLLQDDLKSAHAQFGAADSLIPGKGLNTKRKVA